MRLRIDITTSGDGLDKLAQKLNRLEVPMRQAGLYMERELKMGFARQSDPDGKPWQALKPSTLRRKKTRSILRETGTLAAGISLVSVSSTSATVAATAGSEYGIFHQTGTSKMAQRQIIGIGERHIPQITKIFESYLES
ncbi:phage virion morphogenesis protein [Leptolyngbya ohadii]|uniref:phage virion morphogenesis protein n=1 Tax=Leptolyngbya ohadii TaxID=1962290 RepID=UPI0015C5EB6C|nr:phage virion morphogenesis protein [Leptolyngbya ohadii]